MADPQRTREKITTAVQQLVSEAADSDKASRVSRIAFDPGQAKMTWPSHWPHDTIFRPGSYCTDRYMVVDFINRGGIAEVYEARDMLDEVLVALKVVRASAQTEEVLGKVAAEARTLKVVQHANVLRVFDAGYLAAEGILFFTMERLLGATLHDLIYRSNGARSVPRAPALPMSQVVRMGVGIARGVNALHELKIFHRDIKPENLFFTRDGDVKVFDLDVAKFSEMCELRTTQPGYTMGTVLYMSPEMLQHGTTTARGDIYAIGLVLFELVAGHHAFAEDPEQVLAQADVIAWHSARTPPRLSQRIEGVPIAFDAIVRKCVAKDPGQRFQTCSELADKLTLLEQLLLRAEVGRPPVPRPDAVIQAEGTQMSPRLPHATTAPTRTAVPETPYEILPPPLFDGPTEAEVAARGPQAAEPVGPAVVPGSGDRRAAEPAGAAPVPPTRRSGPTEDAKEAGATSGVRPTEEARGEHTARPGPVTAPASHPRGPRGTEIMRVTGRAEEPTSAPSTPGGTERMVGLTYARRDVESTRPLPSAAALENAAAVLAALEDDLTDGAVAISGEVALPSVEAALASLAGELSPSEGGAGAPGEASKTTGTAAGLPAAESVARAVQPVPRRARGDAATRRAEQRGPVWVYAACVLAGMLLPLLVWGLSGLRARDGAASSVTGAPMTATPSMTGASTMPALSVGTANVSADVRVEAPAASVEAPAASVEAPAASVEAPVVPAPTSWGGGRAPVRGATPSTTAAAPSATPTAGSGSTKVAWPRNAGAPRSSGKLPAIAPPKKPANPQRELYLEP